MRISTITLLSALELDCVDILTSQGGTPPAEDDIDKAIDAVANHFLGAGWQNFSKALNVYDR